MKAFILLFLISLPVFAKRSTVMYTVRSVEAQGDEVMVTFEENNQVFRFHKGARVLPCLENAYKSGKKAVLWMNKKADVIVSCKLNDNQDWGL